MGRKSGANHHIAIMSPGQRAVIFPPIGAESAKDAGGWMPMKGLLGL